MIETFKSQAVIKRDNDKTTENVGGASSSPSLHNASASEFLNFVDSKSKISSEINMIQPS